MIIYVMGVSGSGKSTIGQLLSDRLEIPFVDGDDFHPPTNVEKMRNGSPLNDEDRKGWLAAIHRFAYKAQHEKGAIIACSALKTKYRDTLSKDLNSVRWVYLKGSFTEIKKRMEQRKNHFMPEALLQSQFDTLEEPKEAIVIGIEKSPEVIIEEVLPLLS